MRQVVTIPAAIAMIALAACTGPQGPAGPPGGAGPAGPVGPAGPQGALANLHCGRSDGGWVCKVVLDERSALETKIARLQSENATLKKQVLGRGLPISGASPGEPELRLPRDAEVDKVMSFLEKVWRRLIEIEGTCKRTSRGKIDELRGCDQPSSLT